MQRIRPSKLRWLWPAALVVLILLHFWSPKLGSGVRHDSYSATTEGKLAFYYLLQEDPELLDLSVSRNRDPLARTLATQRFFHFEPDQMRRTVCILGPARYPNAAEWSILLDWVKRGGYLVFAARHDQPEFSIEDVGIKVQRLRGEIDADSDQIKTRLIDKGRIVWKSRAKIASREPSETLFSAEGTDQVVRMHHGSGTIVVIASDYIFSNQSLAWADHSNAELALRLVQFGLNQREFIIDESLNASGTPKVVGLLLTPLFKPLSIQLLIVIVLFSWWRSTRFGPLLPSEVTARHNIVDHTDAVGALHFKSRDGTAALRAYLRQFFAELNLKAYKGREDRVIEPIAVRLGKSVEAVRKLFRNASKAARNTELNRRDAAAVIRKLAIVRRAARRQKTLQRPKRNSEKDPA